MPAKEDINAKEFDPLSLSINGDKLLGCGTTDCLGHVDLVYELMKRLGETKPQLKSTVVFVFIAREENSSIPRVNVNMLVKDRLLDILKQGPLVDDSSPGSSHDIQCFLILFFGNGLGRRFIAELMVYCLDHRRMSSVTVFYFWVTVLSDDSS
ncbi:Acetylornithine deacetylase [Capsicum baccatum]|uniref:Acetylornithine deacetylase n=1 Tax=Capsicum baccatum TaxID=33114 RepID=A0A2G2WXZ8_CAPBA|nr:Acetylornithine deacetylase [Capsicum baccatum]